MQNMLNEDGVLILSVPNGRNDNFIGHINFWSPESWGIYLKENCTKFQIKTFGVMNGLVSIIQKNN